MSRPKKSVFRPRLTDVPALGMDADSIAADIKHYFSHTLGRHRDSSGRYVYTSLVLALRDRLVERWRYTRFAYDEADSKRAFYLSLEFLMGRALGNALLNLGLDEVATEALGNLGTALEEVGESERDAGLGNGGLGRLAACFLDSCATLQLPVMGYGLRYEYGMFRQEITDGFQLEEPDHWLRDGNPWEIERPEYAQSVKFGGRSEYYRDHEDNLRVRWVDTQDVVAVPYDVPVPGYRNGTVNTLRLWKATATEVFDLAEFNAGDYADAVAMKNAAEHITMVLYPNDASENGKELRLKQQYFLASASLQDAMRQWLRKHEDFSQFADKNCFQLNDTHPTCAVAEMMRLLMDEHEMGWDEAWDVTRRTMAYTNHTLLPEALEKWPVRVFRSLLPRLLDIILEINARYLEQVSLRWPGDGDRLRRMSIIEEGDDPQVRMAYLAVVASSSVNGVAELHSKLLTAHVFNDFHRLWPKKFNNKTNGVTPRRWLQWSNSSLSALITEAIGDGWKTDLTELRRLTPLADDGAFRARWRAVKQENKMRLATLVEADAHVSFDTDALFDVQVKRIHEYKRQLLNILHVIHLYDRIKRGDTKNWVPRCVLIGGKAAPGYAMAKQIIKLANNVARVVNSDPAVDDYLKMAFLPDYRVSAMEVICAGAELSEQISTAGKEASGTGNMKFMMNGAITIGTLDGANIEILEEAGADNFFLCGLNAEEVEAKRDGYDPRAVIAGDPDLKRVMQLLQNGHFNRFEPGVFDDVLRGLTDYGDYWMVLADFRSYVDAQTRVDDAYRDKERWTRMSILNTAASGKFSSDRTILDYNRDIWKLPAVPAWPVK